jgi:transposase
MRSITVLRRLLGVAKMFVQSALFRRDGTPVVDVRPTARRSRCGQCGQVAPRYDRRYERGWRHLPWGRESLVPPQRLGRKETTR